MNKNKISLLALFLLSGCSLVGEDLGSLSSEIDSTLLQKKERNSNYSVYDRPYLSVNTDSQSRYIPVSFFSKQNLSLIDVLDVIEKQFKISYYIADQRDDKKTEAETLGVKTISFEGNLDDFITYIGNVYGVSLDIKGNSIEVNYQITKTYSLNQFLDDTKSTASINIGGGATSSGGLKGNSESTVESDTWDKLTDYLEDIVGEDGVFVVLKDFSIINVTAKPSVISALDKLFDRLKAESEMQVSIHYRIVSMTKSTLDHLSADLGLNIQDGNLSFTSELINSLPSGTGASLDIANTTSSSVSSRLDALVKRIASSVVAEGQFVGLPNRIMPVNLTTTSSYISKIEREQNQNNDTTIVSVNTADINTGLSMMLLPKVLDDGRIQVTSGFTRKELISLTTVASGIQLPTISENETLTTVTLDSGNVELITLFKEEKTGNTKAAQLLGLGAKNSLEENVIGVFIGVESYKLSSSLLKR
ncbi:MAG: pilus assembly protein [Vibrio sp.]